MQWLPCMRYVNLKDNINYLILEIKSTSAIARMAHGYLSSYSLRIIMRCTILHQPQRSADRINIVLVLMGVWGLPCRYRWCPLCRKARRPKKMQRYRNKQQQTCGDVGWHATKTTIMGWCVQIICATNADERGVCTCTLVRSRRALNEYGLWQAMWIQVGVH